MRTREFNWFDTENRVPVFSFQVLKDGVWHNVANNGKPLFFATEEERNAARKAFNKKPKKQKYSDEALSEIIHALNDYAVDCDPHEYGLPTYNTTKHPHMVDMFEIIRKILEKRS